MDDYGFDDEDEEDYENSDIQRMSDKTGIEVEEIMNALGQLPQLGQINIKRAKAIYFSSTSSYAKQLAALNKWNELSLALVAQATTIEEIKAAYRSAPPAGGNCQSATLKKWIELASTIGEINEVYDQTSECSDEYDSALIKWNELSLALVVQATTIEEIKAAYRSAPDPSNDYRGIVKLAALKKWIKLASTIRELDVVSGIIDEDNELQTVVRKRKTELFLPLINQTNNTRQLRSFLSQNPSWENPSSEVVEKILGKMISLASTIRAIKDVYRTIEDWELYDGVQIQALKNKCILKLAGLFQLSSNFQQGQALSRR